MASWLFGPSISTVVTFSDAETRRTVEVKRDGASTRLPLFLSHEAVVGTIQIRNPGGKRVEHSGMRLELVGHVELFFDRSNNHQFLTLTKILSPPGILTDELTTHDFRFEGAEQINFESYNGINVRLRYFIRFFLETKKSLSNVVSETDLWIHRWEPVPEINNTIKMEVGIEDCLHIEFEYDKSKYHLKDVIIGKIFFLLVKIKIRHMELSLIRRETTGTLPSQFSESDTIIKYEIMDGAPVRGESVPIRLFLGGFELTPTYRSIHKKFSVRYYLNLVLVDEDDRRYFKQQEIIIYRKKPSGRRAQPTQMFVSERELPKAAAQ